jgi:hypothetical protein
MPVEQEVTFVVNTGSRDRSVGIATGYGFEGLDSIPGRVKIFFSSPQGTDRLWFPLNLLPNGYRGRAAVAWN